MPGVNHLYTYSCNWPLHIHLDYYEPVVGSEAIANSPAYSPNQTMTELLISAELLDKELNELSIYLDQASWRTLY